MIWSVIRIVVGVYVGFGILLYLFQSRFLYFPVRDLTGTPDQMGWAYEDLSLRAADGVKLDAWFVPAEGAKATVLFCHGNAGNVSHRMDTLRILRELGLNVLIFDYRGYGRSDGKPTEKGTYLDAEAAWQYLVERRGLSPKQIIVHGRSLGGAIAADLAARRQPAALIVESAFTSVPDLAAKLYPVYPVRLMSRFRYDTRRRIAEVGCPVLVAHSAEDEMIPFAHGRRLFEAAKEPKEFLELAGGHNDGFIQSEDQYKEALARFIAAHVKK